MSPEFHTPEGWRREAFTAMGCTVSLLLPERQAEAGREVVRALFTEWERQLSRFLPESELTCLNRQAGKPVRVGALLYTVLMRALEAARATAGIYDPTLHHQLVALGYDRSFDALASDTSVSLWVQQRQAAEITRGGAWRRIAIDPATRTVTLPPGAALDFGGIAKGMAVDAAIGRLRQRGIRAALVNAGGDLAVLGTPPEGDDWPIAVPGKATGWTLPLRSGALATSGVARRHWQQGGQRRHHLLDPRTGLPAESGLWSVTVAAERCEQAEVAAKVAFVLGAQRGAAFLDEHGLAGLLVRQDGTPIGSAAWPAHLVAFSGVATNGAPHREEGML